jgi:hypothetical protein
MQSNEYTWLVLDFKDARMAWHIGDHFRVKLDDWEIHLKRKWWGGQNVIPANVLFTTNKAIKNDSGVFVCLNHKGLEYQIPVEKCVFANAVQDLRRK